MVLSGYKALASSIEMAASNIAASANSKGRVLVCRSKSMGFAGAWHFEDTAADFISRKVPCAGRLRI
jgi:hypothetical protein